MPPKYNLDANRYDQSSYLGRVRHFLTVIDPTTLLTTDAQLAASKQLIADYKAGKVTDNDVTEKQLWRAKQLQDAIVHPDTQEAIPVALRWSAFVPANVPMVVGMMAHAHSLPMTMFWQWANQSYNVCVNYGNRNASIEMSNQQIATAYGSAVAVSMGVAAGLKTAFGKVDMKKMPPFAGRMLPLLVPYFAVASAGAFNVSMMRWNEMEVGVNVKDADGNTVGVSKEAGKKALITSALSRIALPVPVLMAPPLVTSAVNAAGLMPKNPRLQMLVNVGIVTACLWGALPLAIGIFPQEMEVPVTELEPEFHDLKNAAGDKINSLFFNKGL